MTLSIPSLSWLVVRSRFTAPISILSCCDSLLFSLAISCFSSSSWNHSRIRPSDSSLDWTFKEVLRTTCWLLPLSPVGKAAGRETLHSSLSRRPASSRTCCMVFVLLHKAFMCSCKQEVHVRVTFLKGNAVNGQLPCRGSAVWVCADTPAAVHPCCVTADDPRRSASGERCNPRSSPKRGARYGWPTSGGPGPTGRDGQRRCRRSCCWLSKRPARNERAASHLRIKARLVKRSVLMLDLNGVQTLLTANSSTAFVTLEGVMMKITAFPIRWPTSFIWEIQENWYYWRRKEDIITFQQ